MEMTIEKAAELVECIEDKFKKVELFDYFYHKFNLKSDERRANMFAEMCGYVVCTNVDIME